MRHPVANTALTAVVALMSASPGIATAATWNLRVDADGALLAHGPLDADTADVVLRCAPHEGVVHLFVMLKHEVEATMDASGAWIDESGREAPWPTRLSLRADGVSAELVGKASRSEENSGTGVTAELSPGAPILAAFRRSGALTFRAYGEAYTARGAPAGRVARFVAACWR